MYYIRDNFTEYGEAELARDMALLPAWRREQAERFRFFQGKRDCTVSYLLLCEALEKEYGITEKPTFVIGEHGKPSLKEYPKIHFNLSHCKEAVACILGDTPVGIDVESIGRYNEGVARYSMNDSEMSLILDSPNPEIPFTELWTKKEALVKCLGTGITDDIKGILTSHTLSEGGESDLKRQILIETYNNIDKKYILSIAQTRK